MTRVTILISHIRGLITPLITTPEPPSRGSGCTADCRGCIRGLILVCEAEGVMRPKRFADRGIHRKISHRFFCGLLCFGIWG